jgi:tetratricopeptide (TPR) repeat protein
MNRFGRVASWGIVVASIVAAVARVAEAASADETAHVRIIVVGSEEKARQTVDALANGADFAALARQGSQDASAKDGGDLGAVRPASLRPELQAALKGLPPGQVSGIVKVGTGYAVLEIVAESQLVDATVRQAPDTAGLLEVEVAFQRIPRASGWNQDLAAICQTHQTVVPRLRERVTAALSRRAGLAPIQEMQYSYILAVLESYQGRMAEAIAHWEDAYQVILKNKPDASGLLEEVLGTAHLHKAEMDSDVYRRPGEQCLFPPRPDRPPPKLAKSQDVDAAIRYFSKYLAKKPDDLEVKWLLNLAYLALGQYPDGVPAEHRVPRDTFDCQGKAPRFEDVAPQAGLDVSLVSGGIVVDDFDGDHRLDVVVSGYDACERLRFFHNNGDGTFSDRSEPSGLGRVPGAANITQADYDNDGCADLLVMRGGWQIPMPLSLVRGHCNGTFTDVTGKAGLDKTLFATQTAAWADIDNDGWLDLFVGHEQEPSQLFRNNGDGTFANISASAGIDRTAFTKTVAAGDYDEDGFPDFYVSNIRGRANFLYRNNGDLTFTEVAEKAGVSESWRSFAAWFFDYDNDGRLDLFVASDYASVEETMRTYLRHPRQVGPMALYKNAGDGTFHDVGPAVGLDKVLMPMGANFGDMDGDGYLDIYLGTGSPDYGSLVPNVLFRNQEGKTFADVSTCTGTGELHKAHGIAFADLENDGNEDLAVEMGGAVPGDAHALRLFRNPGSDNRWLGVKLVGTKTNRAGLGARLKATVATRDGKTRTIHHTVGTGGSWGASSLRQLIGLGAAAKLVALEVFWPASKTRQTFTKVAMNQYIEIQEGAPAYRRLDLKSCRLGGSASSSVRR